MVATSARAPGLRRMRPSLMTSLTVLAGSPFSNATLSRKAGSNSISPRIARSVMAETCRFMPTWSASLAEILLADHRGIHVGEQELSCAGPGLVASPRPRVHPRRRRARGLQARELGLR